MIRHKKIHALEIRNSVKKKVCKHSLTKIHLKNTLVIITYKLQTLVLFKMTFVCLLGYHKPHIDNMMQRCILLNMYLTKCVNTRSFIKLFSSSLLLLMFSPLFFHIHLFITNHLYSSKHCQNKIGFLTDYLVGVFVIVCLCVCVYGLLQILRLCVSVNFCVCEYIIMCVRQ